MVLIKELAQNTCPQTKITLALLRKSFECCLQSVTITKSHIALHQVDEGQLPTRIRGCGSKGGFVRRNGVFVIIGMKKLNLTTVDLAGEIVGVEIGHQLDLVDHLVP